MATADTATASAAPAPPRLAAGLEWVYEFFFVAIIGLSCADQNPLPEGYRLPMLAVAGLLAVLALARRGELLLRPEWGMAVGLAFGLLLTTAKGRRIGSIELFAEPDWWGVPITWAGIAAAAIVAAYLTRQALDGFRGLRSNPYALSLLTAAVLMAGVEFGLAFAIRRAGKTLLLDVPIAFAALALQYAAFLCITSGQMDGRRMRRLAAVAAVGLVLKALVFHHLGVDPGAVETL